VALVFVLPPSLGAAKATARAELLDHALVRALDAPVRVVVAETYAEIGERVASGEAHVVWAPAAVCAGLVAARAVFTVVRGGRVTYRSALVGRREQALTLDALAGTRAAWVDPLSAGGYLLVAALLRERGVDLDRTFAAQSFAGSHRTALEAVLHGVADVTAVSVLSADAEAIAERLRWYVGPSGDRLATLGLSAVCPNDALVLTTALTDEAAAELADKLIPTTPSARARSRLLAALEAEGLVRADLAAYHALRGTLIRPAAPIPETRRSVPPPGSLSGSLSGSPPGSRPSQWPPRSR
jgi:phosphonate transport system substrate-binding protein